MYKAASPWMWYVHMSFYCDTRQLKRYAPTGRPDDGPTLLSRCRALQELELDSMLPGGAEVDILSSITSTSIQKISLVLQRQHRVISWRGIKWEMFDEPLYRIADRPGRTHKLEVVIRVKKAVTKVNGSAGLARIADSLARFKEKGHIKVIWLDPSGREHVVYPPPPFSAE